MSRKSLVIACTCHGTLSSAIPEQAMADAIAVRRQSVRLEFMPSLCRQKDLDNLYALIEREKPASVLVAACSPFAKGRGVLDGIAARDCQVPVFLADIREGCAWIHAGDPESAAAKAADLICMGLTKLEHQEGVAFTPVRVEKRVLVVGAGPAGLAAAGTLAQMGMAVTLADRLGRMGGLLNQIGRLFPHNIPSQDLLSPLLRGIEHPAVEFLPKTSVTRIDGDPGRFEAHLNREGRDEVLTAGAVILACGAQPVLPENRFRAGELPGVISQLELETRLKKLEAEGAVASEFRSAVFIQCIAAREDAHPYCSSICCPTALKNAVRIKTLSPEIAVTVLHRGIMAPGKVLEELYRRAMAAGVRFVVYDPTDPPEVRGNGHVASVFLRDGLSTRSLELPADIVALSTPLKPRPETAGLAEGLCVRLDNMGFACGREPMQPLSAPVSGVYLCGTARWPVSADRAVEQGRAAAMKAAAFLAEGEIHRKALALAGPVSGTASTRTEACSRCGQCIAVCPYGACRRDDDGRAVVSGARCRGCGLCAAVCPSGAARVPEHNSTALRAMLREIAPRIVL